MPDKFHSTADRDAALDELYHYAERLTGLGLEFPDLRVECSEAVEAIGAVFDGVEATSAEDEEEVEE